jgi:hypothetical protein
MQIACYLFKNIGHIQSKWPTTFNLDNNYMGHTLEDPI